MSSGVARSSLWRSDRKCHRAEGPRSRSRDGWGFRLSACPSPLPLRLAPARS
ncbi:hypothetical protein [Ornithinimicrobium kibberense]|uniref:hypothetical protein n=1 Tax=Ornithinimicrobium kibberense TaxID=282060 RepID=UPI003614F52E